MQRLEVSRAVRRVYIYVVRRQTAKAIAIIVDRKLERAYCEMWYVEFQKAKYSVN
jgi:hypothetical protein